MVNRIPSLDLCIIGRGGGSKEDLSAFDDERVCRAVAALRAPCISAVGHETDVSLTDLVADARAATPSAAVERVLPDRVDTLRHVHSLASRLAHGLRRRTALVAARLARSGDRMQVSMSRRLQLPRARLDRYAGQLGRRRANEFPRARGGEGAKTRGNSRGAVASSRHRVPLRANPSLARGNQ